MGRRAGISPSGRFTQVDANAATRVVVAERTYARHVHKSEVSGILYYFERSWELVHKFYDAIQGT